MILLEPIYRLPRSLMTKRRKWAATLDLTTI
jgi:hypothetical protein